LAYPALCTKFKSSYLGLRTPRRSETIFLKKTLRWL
jgi:hypothetical protein